MFHLCQFWKEEQVVSQTRGGWSSTLPPQNAESTASNLLACSSTLGLPWCASVSAATFSSSASAMTLRKLDPPDVLKVCGFPRTVTRRELLRLMKKDRVRRRDSGAWCGSSRVRKSLGTCSSQKGEDTNAKFMIIIISLQAANSSSKPLKTSFFTFNILEFRYVSLSWLLWWLQFP